MRYPSHSSLDAATAELIRAKAGSCAPSLRLTAKHLIARARHATVILANQPLSVHWALLVRLLRTPGVPAVAPDPQSAQHLQQLVERLAKDGAIDLAEAIMIHDHGGGTVAATTTRPVLVAIEDEALVVEHVPSQQRDCARAERRG